MFFYYSCFELFPILISYLIPILNNVDVAMPFDIELICDALLRQSWNPVRWIETIQAITALGITHIIECGPGKVLSALNRRIDKRIVQLSIADPDALKIALNIVSRG